MQPEIDWKLVPVIRQFCNIGDLINDNDTAFTFFRRVQFYLFYGIGVLKDGIFKEKIMEIYVWYSDISNVNGE